MKLPPLPTISGITGRLIEAVAVPAAAVAGSEPASAEAGVSRRDSVWMLGVSHQRVQQLVAH